MKKMILGVSIIAIGTLFLLKNLGILSQDVGSILWPILLIILGFYFLLKRGTGFRI